MRKLLQQVGLKQRNTIISLQMEIGPWWIGTGTLGGPGSASVFEALRSCLVPQEQKYLSMRTQNPILLT